MIQLNKRQSDILYLIRVHEKLSNQEIKIRLEETFGEISRVTITRDIRVLLNKNLIKKNGRGRNVYYLEVVSNPALSYLDVANYFKVGPDLRKIAFEKFNFEVFENLEEIFSREELKELETLNKNCHARINKLSPTIFKKELERLIIELSWKSSQIEGNTYSLIDTEILIKEHKEAKGHKKEEAIMILNHKKTLDHILSNKNYFQKINIRKIEDLHYLLIDGLNVSKGIRKNMVGIVGTKYKPLDNQYQIKEALEKMLKLIETTLNPFLKSFLVLILIPYIQPFEDGNKRTSRLLSNAILLAYNICPLSYRSIDEADYKKAIIIFYEQNNLRFFKELFIQQFKFAVKNYFGVTRGYKDSPCLSTRSNFVEKKN
ncbi:MAG: Fic family protein [Patescibacteria group bacterium]